MIRFFIYAGILIAVAGVLWLVLVYLPSLKNKPDGITHGTPEEPPVVLPEPVPTNINVPLGFGSIKVNQSDVTFAQSPDSFFNSVPENDLAGYNVLTSPVSGILKKVHFDTAFSSTCVPYIWYNKAVYSLIGTTTTPQGVQTCYYEYKRSVLPAKLRIKILQSPCTVFNYYLGDVRYQYKELVIEGMALQGKKYYCVYEKK